ncbi:MAG TPA: 6-hydroxymethylpterin diphosphokinase MptE-like protein [Candidatus Bathyarchaeia archaeon]|nr:6-hydroxymethylpterin diphosphokinase MptE-like protein [Candidatus Bathyarchaeia archaeon]
MKKYLPLSNEDYTQICTKLAIDPKTDNLVTRYLSKHLSWLKIRISTKVLRNRLENKIALIFGAGPSLPETIAEISSFISAKREKLAIIAADGALKALLENNLLVDVVVTDLDGSLSSIRDSLKSNCNVVIHSHGDNLPKLKLATELLSQLGVIGSTQGKSNCKVKNFGGFTDGDRAAHLAANFGAKSIILLAFDFGSIVGKYSKPDLQKKDFQAPKRKLAKFSIAKELLTKLPFSFPNISFYNATLKGEQIDNWNHLSVEELLEIINNN